MYKAPSRGVNCIKFVVLGNEKYKGDAILQKTFCTDFLTKKFKGNTAQYGGTSGGDFSVIHLMQIS